MSEFTNDPACLSYEAVANQEQRDRIDQAIARSTALYAKMGVDKSKGIGFSPYIDDQQWSVVMYFEDEETVNVHLLPLDEFGHPNSTLAENLKYEPATGRQENSTSPVHSSSAVSQAEQQQSLQAKAVTVFDSFVEKAISMHWKFLMDQRSPEQKEEAQAQLKQAKAICDDLLATAPWEEKDTYSTSHKVRVRKFKQNETNIREVQFGRVITPELTWLQRLLKIELPDHLVWEKLTTMQAQLGEINFSVLDTSRPRFSVFSDEHELESENFDDPSQLHIEADLLEKLRQLKETKT